MSKLTAKERNALPSSEFAGPDRSYPIQDMNHAKNALSRVSEFGTQELKKHVRSLVDRKYPELGKTKE